VPGVRIYLKKTMKTNFVPKGLIVILAGSLLLSCSKGGSTTSGYGNTTNNNPNTTNTSGNTVLIAGMSFSPGSLTVKAGTTVTWTNNDNTLHTVTADDASFSSGDMNKGSTFSHTFSTAGTYAYHCNYHAAMKASVVAN
jgi:plastocyanin